MIKTLPNTLAFLIPFAVAHAQVPPAVTGPKALPGSGIVHYALHYSQTAEFGSSLGDWQTSSASATADYANNKTNVPFSLNYSGGYTWTLTGPAYATGLFQHLFLSQGFVWDKWNAVASDDVSYRPQAPTTGFSGIPGIGEPIGVSSPAPPSSQSILTLNTHVVDNTVAGDLSRRVGSAYSVSVGGSSYLLRYPDANGIDTDSLTANGELSRRLNSRDSIAGRYLFSQFSYPNDNFRFITHTGLLDFTRAWNRKISTDIAAGPEWTTSSDSAVVPSALRPSAKASLTYHFRSTAASISYNRYTNGGGGYLIGAESDSGIANLSRDFGRSLTVGFDGAYTRTAGLLNNGITTAKYGGIQITRRFGPEVTIFANYTATDQSTSSALPANTLSGLLQMASVGIGYGSRERHAGH